MTPVVLKGKRSILFVTYGNAWPDPPQRQALLSFAQSFDRVVLFQGKEDEDANWVQARNVEVYKEHRGQRIWAEGSPFGRLMRLILFRSRLNRCVRDTRPDVVVTYMFHALAALPVNGGRKL